MEQSKSTPRYPQLKSFVFLAQTDTTVGFLSQDAKKLASIKRRPNTKPFLKNIFALKDLSLRVPKKHKKLLRRSKQTTFVIKNEAFRIAKPKAHSTLLEKLQWCYSTSANQSGESFSQAFAFDAADVIVINHEGLFESSPSKIIKLSNHTKKRLR